MLPGFQPTLEGYLARLEKLSYEIIALCAEALGLAPDAFDPLFFAEGTDKAPGQVMHRAKVRLATLVVFVLALVFLVVALIPFIFASVLFVALC